MSFEISPSAPPMMSGGEMGRVVRDTGWSATPLGAFSTWPQSLRSSLSLVLNTPGIAALYWGAEQRLLYNDAYGAALGDRHPWAFGLPMSEALPDIAPVLGPQVAQALATGQGFAIKNLSMAMRRHDTDEDTVWTYSFSPVQGERGGFAGVMLLATEMTEQKAAERRRDEAEEALRALTALLEGQVEERTRERDRIWQHSQDMLGIADEHGVWLSVSPAWSRVLGWRSEEIVGRTSEWMEHPDDRPRTRAQVNSLIAGNTTAAFENRFRTRDGDYRRLSWTATPEGGVLYCVARDVTEVRSHAAALAEQAAARERSWSYTPDLLSIIDLPSAAFERVNPAWTTALGWSTSDIEGKPFSDFVHPEDMNASTTAFGAARRGQPALRFESRYRTKHGGWRWLSWVTFSEGDKLYSSCRDITADRERAAALHLFENIVQSDDAPICAFDR